MAKSLFLRSKLESLLQSRWTEFLDRAQVMRTVLENVRDTDYREILQAELPPNRVKLSVTKIAIQPSHAFEVWIEFSVPKDPGVVIGTNVYTLDLTGKFELKDSYGTHFLPEISHTTSSE